VFVVVYFVIETFGYTFVMMIGRRRRKAEEEEEEVTMNEKYCRKTGLFTASVGFPVTVN
jgi:hypothetical protein